MTAVHEASSKGSTGSHLLGEPLVREMVSEHSDAKFSGPALSMLVHYYRYVASEGLTRSAAAAHAVGSNTVSREVMESTLVSLCLDVS
ncbi:hypothetical protein DIPPA_21921 [Diplonema papillatum]|nr:hypothetical protein DIPPA_21921 [Diplonema papillatum]